MGKVFVVVGASSGIGAALAKRLVDDGHQVHGLCRHFAEGVEFHEVDVCSGDPLPEIAGPIDGLAYLPGTINLKPLANLTEEDFRNDWEINTLGAFRVVKHFLPNLRESEGSSIVLMSTVAVAQGMPFHVSVASAKAGVEGLMRSLAAELAPHIRVNAVAPSLSDTPLAAQILSSDAKREAAAKRHPLQRVGQPEDIAQAIHFLLNDESSWVTGQVLNVDGGLSSLKLL